MLSKPERQEIDHRTIKLIVGLIALSLAALTSLFAREPLRSISASYYEGGWSQAIFIGFLFAIGALMLSYNGLTLTEMVLSKIASIAAAGVALFPCACGDHKPLVPFVHGFSAAVMFVILAFFAYGFYKRAREKGHTRANIRATIYALCAATIIVSIIALAYDNFSKGALTKINSQFVFYGEASGLIAFGLSWLIASRVLPGLTSANERFSLLARDNPP